MIEIGDRPEKLHSAGVDNPPVFLSWLENISAFLGPETIIFLFIWSALMVVGRSRFFLDPGALWHPVVGKMILDGGHLIYSDPFSFTCAGKPWIDQWWLGDCFLALLHELGGLDTILLGTSALLAGLFTWIAHRLMARGLHPLPAALVTALTCLASSYHIHPRPHLATIIFMALTLAWLSDFEAGRISPRRLFWLVPMFVVWTNIHGGMVGGVATMALVI